MSGNNRQKIRQIGNWRFRWIGKNIYKIYYSLAGVNYITMTGSDVTTELRIPWSHRWNSTHFRHADSANADSTIWLDIIIRRKVGKNFPATFEEYLLQVTDTSAAKRSDLWGEMFEREPSVYEVVLNGTNTHQITPVFYVQKLREAE